MRPLIYIVGIALLLPMCTNKSNDNHKPFSLIWEMGKNGIERGYYESTFYLVNNTNDTLAGNWVIYLCQHPGSVKPNPEAPAILEVINGTYFKIYPSSHYLPVAPGDTLPMSFLCRGGIIKQSDAPEGAYCVMLDADGNESAPCTIDIEVKPFTHDYQWSREWMHELPYPDGNYVYDRNAVFSEKPTLKSTDLFPSLKSVQENGGAFSFTKEVRVQSDSVFANEASLLKEKLGQMYDCIIMENAPVEILLRQASFPVANDEYYQMELADGRIEIKGNTPHAIFNGTQTLLAMLGNNTLPCALPNVGITDYPDLFYRGIMLDVARNFTSKAHVMQLIDLLASYKINVLHFHIADDEGWRVEIPGLEELTAVGSRRGHTHDENDCLIPAYCGGWDPNDPQSTANGYYTRDEFIELLQYAQAHHVKVIPEIDMPGHSRAAIKAMNNRYRKYIHSDEPKAEEFLLIDFADTSRYVSAQCYTDNVINVALPGVYRFVKKVVDEISAMYHDAGVPLTILHLGGDEVPRGAWTGSEIANQFMKEKGFREIRELKDYFISQVVSILSEKNIQLAGWQEVGLLPDETPNPKFAGKNILSYCWNTVPEWNGDQVPYRLANAGYPIVLCNVTNLYFDMSYSKHPAEPGLYWGGFVNEYNPFNVVPYEIYKSIRYNLAGDSVDILRRSQERLALSADRRNEIVGIQAQLWAETIRDFDRITYYIFPKLFGLTERAWNAFPVWADDPYGELYDRDLQIYNAKIAQRELPRLAAQQVTFRVAQPGIKLIDGYLYANSTIPDAEIRYTIDGSEPNKKSILWTSPIACTAKLIKAKSFYCGRESVTTLLKPL
ncbi:MAG: family 20 glycosylhydrolase [Dysgonamonadaceae bacterium]|nr:family 20 glycosylhydrolase [Dysgonamonadaceae bacterium]